MKSLSKNLHSGVTELVVIIVITVLILAVGFFAWKSGAISTSKNQPSQKQATTTQSSTEDWTEIGIAIAGNYADADVVDVGSGKFRMYYSLEPEQPGFQGQVYSATSTDGLKWAQEAGTRISSATSDT